MDLLGLKCATKLKIIYIQRINIAKNNLKKHLFFSKLVLNKKKDRKKAKKNLS